MSSSKKSLPLILVLSLAVAIAVAARAQSNPAAAPSASAGQGVMDSSIPPPAVNVPSSAADQFERNPILSLPGVFANQMTPGTTVPPEALISEQYLRTADLNVRKITLKEA